MPVRVVQTDNASPDVNASRVMHGKVPAPTNSTIENVNSARQVHECHKFLVLTTQRSGSTWFCEALGHQTEVHCPPLEGEMLIQYSFKSFENVSIEEWTRAADEAFNRVCREAEQQGKDIAGFKLMYDQVKGPFRTLNGAKLPEQWFFDYLVKHRVRIVHLVREAAILHLASDFHTHVNSQTLQFADTFASHHTADKKDAEARKKVKKMRFRRSDLPRLKRLEKEHRQWLLLLKATGLPYQYLSYEDLMSFRRDTVVHMVLQFLGVKNMISYPRLQGSLLRTHKSYCEDRIADWDQVKPLLNGTMSLRACNMLSAQKDL